jgi:hypothetical protein
MSLGWATCFGRGRPAAVTAVMEREGRDVCGEVAVGRAVRWRSGKEWCCAAGRSEGLAASRSRDYASADSSSRPAIAFEDALRCRSASAYAFSHSPVAKTRRRRRCSLAAVTLAS